MCDGSSAIVSLSELFTQASTVIGIDAAPHERVSLIRLLVCLTQAALGAPASCDNWNDFGQDKIPEVTAYLARPEIRCHLELFGSGPRFLQIEVPRLDEPVLASKLMPHLATGNGATVLDHAGGSERAFAPAKLALALLTFQNFYPLYGAGYKGKGPCAEANMAHTLLTGRSLADTILLNCLDADSVDEFYPGAGMGRPIWELSTASESGRRNATLSYLGRLVPRHRNLWLHESGMYFDLSNEAMEYPSFEEGVQEPSSTVIVVAKGSFTERRLLPLKMERAIWRDLHTLAVVRATSQQQQQAPLTLQSHIPQLSDSEIHLWVGGLVTDKAKILDTIESSFTVPHSLFSDLGRDMYEKGVEFAEKQSKQLYGAVKTYAASMKHESAANAAASMRFWNYLDERSGLLLQLIADPSLLNGRQVDESESTWTQMVRTAAMNAYSGTCQRVTPRQHKAFIEGLRVLFPRPKSGQPKKRSAGPAKS